MSRVRQMIARVGPRHTTTLIHGESGTGKELVARSLHRHSRRRGGPFVPVDCTTLGDQLFESQMFGHERGAFTGAERPTKGFVRSADGGTLFLDEVGELGPAHQAKLLRFLQESAVVPVGGARPIAVDVRVVAATHRDLAAMVGRGDFRLDLYHRLHVVKLAVAPLRERREDIPLLVDHYLDRLAELYDEPRRRFGGAAAAVLSRAHWRGNVRELINAIEHAYVMSTQDVIDAEHLPEALLAADENALLSTEAAGHAVPDAAPLPPVEPMETAQQRLVESALRHTKGHQGQAAGLLQVERRRLYRMVERFGLRHLTQR